jgi:hypothetical protein
MGNIDDVRVWGNTGHDTFHYAYIAIACAEVGHEGDNWS